MKLENWSYCLIRLKAGGCKIMSFEKKVAMRLKVLKVAAVNSSHRRPALQGCVGWASNGCFMIQGKCLDLNFLRYLL